MTRMRGESMRMLLAAVVGGLVTGLVLVGIGALLGVRSEAAGAGTADAAHVRAIYRAASAVGGAHRRRATGRAPGFLVDARGHVVTNAHVVGDRTSVDVDLGGRRIGPRCAASSRRWTLRCSPSAGSQGDVPPLRFGDSQAMRIGDPVVAIGAPFGLNGSLSSGIVSGLRRQIDSPNGFAIQGVIQTDAALNPGNSGGPLLDMDGRVVGMVTQIATESGQQRGHRLRRPERGGAAHGGADHRHGPRRPAVPGHRGRRRPGRRRAPGRRWRAAPRRASCAPAT